MIESTLDRARAGDGEAFRELTEPYRRELQVHCYRILGSVQDAEDTVQETLLAAWRGLGGFRERASVRAWLYRIATNRCLNALRDTGRRPRPAQPARRPLDVPEPTRRSEPAWFEPYPDALLEDLPDTAPGPEARYETREALALSFVAGLQHLPPRQRAVLVLRDVLGFPAAEVADLLDSSGVSVNSALQRARTALGGERPARDRERAPLPRSPRERELVGRFVDALENSDVDRLVALLTEDAWLTMPPEPLAYQGPTAIAGFYQALPWWGGQALRLLPTRANGQPAFGSYLLDPHSPIAHAYGLVVLTLEGDRISSVTRFGDNGLFPLFGLPRTLRDL
ncbi:RNA polymerase sigma-70 factor (ECF subfamily) [Streptomyces griseochromogenes]|uniref:RNA polymerase sigma-70 factor (ECF subfamily) n=1 Tax=Streptomyces griseochromogenes TaxID=68214 RepID=A0ABS4M2I9_9ACTN|nr:sigma-70 family RNA polymerase sigma factor [Streptomyces griseochromogenes]MBP2053873.1 RNA polymerase sigma-70 factor (ECF subfamily) [Streptomyces griseochromogenes]